jgi:hypothetical protein
VTNSNRIFAGVDFSSGARNVTVAVLSSRLEVQHLRGKAVEAAAAELAGMGEISVAIGGPLRTHPSIASAGSPSGKATRRGKPDRSRAAEAEIRRRGIPIRRLPAEEGAAPASVRAGFQLARELSERGFLEGEAERESPRFLMEAPPVGCAAVLLGRIPFPRATLEGRIQRQLLLLRERVELPDPMDSLEEMTAHHLLSGRLSLRGICKPEELDALLAAFTAWRAFCQPEMVTWLGRDEDGWICLPVKELLEKYVKSDCSQ